MQKKYGKHGFMPMKCSPKSSSKALPYMVLYNLKRFSLNATLVHYYFFPTRVFTLEYLCFLGRYSFILLSPLHSMSDQHLISPSSNTAESFIKVMKIKEMMSNLRSFDCQQILLASTKENV